MKLFLPRINSYLLFLSLALLSWESTTAQVQIGSTIISDINTSSLAISGDGSRVAIGEFNYFVGPQRRGRYKVYEFNGTDWFILGTQLVGMESNTRFGADNAVFSDDGNSLLTSLRDFDSDPASGLNLNGKSKLFNWQGSGWVSSETPFFEAYGETPSELLSYSLDMASTDDRFVATAPAYDEDGDFTDQGAFSIYANDPTQGYRPLLQQDGSGGGMRIVGDDEDCPVLGIRAKIGSNGSRVAVLGSGYIKVYDFVPSQNDPYLGDYVQVGSTISGLSTTFNGLRIEMSGDGQMIVVQQSSPNFIRTYEFDGTDWIISGPALFPPFNTQFREIALSPDGQNLFYERRNFGPNNSTIIASERTGNAWVSFGNELTSNASSTGVTVAANAQIILFRTSNTEAAVFDYNAALPVELTNFTLSSARNHVDLHWETASETNNVGFEIERSANGADWRGIGFVAGQGTMNETKRYTYQDAVPAGSQELYYRLKQMDADGRFEYSPVRVARFDQLATGIRLYPNPARDELTLEGVATGKEIFILDQNGREVLRTLAGNRVDVSQLPAAVYTLGVADDPSVNLRFVKQTQ